VTATPNNETPTPALDFTAFDRTVRVQDDLFRHVNGTWLDTAEIPADKPLAGSFVQLRDTAEAAVRDIITTLEVGELDSEVGKIAALYASFMDFDTVEAAGATPLAPLLEAIDAVDSPEALARTLGEFVRTGVTGLVGLDTESDPGDPTRYVMFAGQGGLGLPDEEYYRLDDYQDIRAAYRKHIAAALGLAGIDDADGQADAVLELETEIAATHWDKVRCRDLRQMYNLVSLADFTAAAPGLHWREFLAGAEINEDTMVELVSMQPSFFS
jgi:putative endopeptidase